MRRYIARRTAVGMLMLLALTVLIFCLLRLAPGDPIDAYINPSAPMSASDLDALRARLGLDQPLPVQYLAWLERGAHRATSATRSSAAASRCCRSSSSRIGPTLLLMGTGIAIAIVVGITGGIVSAVYRNRPIDVVLSALAFVGVSSPAFLTALLGLYVFSVMVRWAPAGGMLTPGAALLDRRPARASRPARPSCSRSRTAATDHALHALVAARGAVAGLRAHRARQGRARVLGRS